MSQRACSNCGHPLTETARFCPHCGHDVTGPGGTVLTASAPPPAPLGGEQEVLPWRAVEAIPIYVLSVIATVIVLIPIGLALRPLSNCGADLVCGRHQDLFKALSIGVNELALLVTVLLWVRLVHKRGPRSLGFRTLTPANALIGVGIGLAGELLAIIVAGILAAIIQSFTHNPVQTPKQISLQTHPAVSVLVIVGISVIGITPFAEEAFFRGFIFRRLGQRYRLGWAVVLSAAIFAVLHLIPFIMLPIFALGALLASVVYARKSLFPSVFAHMTFNAIGFTLQFVFMRK